MTKAQNLDRLSDEAKDLVAFVMDLPNFVWRSSYMIEVQLDDPIRHLLVGEGTIHRHAGGGKRHYANHYGDDDWAIVHCQDEDWRDLDHAAMRARAENRMEEYMLIYGRETDNG